MNLDLLEKSSLLSKLLHLLDCSCIVLFLWLLMQFNDVRWSHHYSSLAFWSFCLCWVTFYSFQLYRSWRGRKLWREFFVIAKAWGATVGALLFSFFFFKLSRHYSRSVMLAWFIWSPFLVFSLHMLVRKTLSIIRSRGMNLKNAVIVGAGDLGIRVARHIENMPWAGIRVKGFFDDRRPEGETVMGDKPVLGRIVDLAQYLVTHPTHYVYLALPMRSEEKIISIISNTRIFGAVLCLVPDFYAYELFNSERQFLGDMFLLNFNPNCRQKRYFDIIFSLLAMIAISPLVLLIALLIKLEDGGPIFYGHRRITTTGKEFKCWKFRTMVVNADKKLKELLDNNPEARLEWEKTFKLKKDPRITRVGRFLRQSSLDELPQFFNVLKGEMSVVGARPVVSAELHNYYKEHAGLYCSMKPGITGPWQVYKRSDTDNYDERVQLDRWYVLNHSLWLDLKIVFKTVFCIFNGRGAY